MVKAVIDEKATGSSISSVSQTSIPTPCATSTRDEDFIWSSSLSDESTIVHLVDKAKADIATGSSISSGSQTAIPTSCATTSTDEDFIWSSSLSDDYVSESSIVHLVDKAKADIATGSSISSGSQTAIPTSCATSKTDEDFIWSSSLSDDYVSESSIVHLVDKAKADIATGTSISSASQTATPTSCATSSTDEVFIWSSSLSDDYVSESSIVHLVDAKADIAKDPELQVRLDVLEKELTEDIGKLNQRANMRSDDSSKRLQKYVDCIMAVFDDFATTTNNDKTKISKCLFEVIVNQFGTSYVKDLFYSYSTDFDRDQLIFDLQLLRSYYFSDRLFRSPSNRSTLPENVLVPHINTKRKLGEGSYEDYDTGDEVTYVDK